MKPSIKATHSSDTKPKSKPPLRHPPISYRIDVAADVVGISKSKLWALIAQGELSTFKIDECTLIRAEDLQAFIDKKFAQSVIN